MGKAELAERREGSVRTAEVMGEVGVIGGQGLHRILKQKVVDGAEEEVGPGLTRRADGGEPQQFFVARDPQCQALVKVGGVAALGVREDTEVLRDGLQVSIGIRSKHHWPQSSETSPLKNVNRSPWAAPSLTNCTAPRGPTGIFPYRRTAGGVT